LKSKKDSWKEKLSPKEYRILREKDTELPFTGKLLHEKRKGIYVCAGCGNELFSSDTKFNSSSGWPSFYDKLFEDKSKKGLELKEDNSHGMKRIEVLCKKCGGHLGHVFQERKSEKIPTGKRYCINSASLKFKDAKK